VRLFFIVENDQPHAAGGGFYAIHKFAEFLSLRGHDVFVFGVHDMRWVKRSARFAQMYRPSLNRNGRLKTRLDGWLSGLCARWLLPRAMRRFHPDWILGVLTHSAVKAEALGRSYRIPVANFIYECPPWMQEVWQPEVFRIGFEDALTQRLWAATRAAYLGSRVLFPNSELSRRHNTAWLGGKAVAEPIYPGIDPGQMPASVAAGSEPICLDPQRKHLLYVGRMAESKNVHHLIAAFLRLGPDAVLHLCGTGSDVEKFKVQAGGSPRIRFHGFVPDDALWSLFRQCSLLVYPTGFEGFGMPPMQALHFGKPCLASDLGIFRSIYGDLLEYFPPGDVDALTQAMQRLLGDPDYCRRRGEAGRLYVDTNFTWARAAETIEVSLSKANHEQP
jgi:glycosyltransferase involved in cell wall biosynthesis